MGLYLSQIFRCFPDRAYVLKPGPRIEFHYNEKSITYGIVNTFCASLSGPDLDILPHSRWTGRGWRKEGAIMSQSLARQKTCHYVKISKNRGGVKKGKAERGKKKRNKGRKRSK